MQDTSIIQLLIQKTGAVLGREFSVATDDRLILDRELTHKVVNAYLQGDATLKPLISQLRVEFGFSIDKSPDFLTRSIAVVLNRCRELHSIHGNLNIASLYFYLFYVGIAIRNEIEPTLPHSIFRSLTGNSLDLAIASRDSPDLQWLISLVLEDILQCAIDIRITSVERYTQLVRDRAWLEYWQLPT